MTRILCSIALIFAISEYSYSQQQDTAKIGMYITNLYDFDIAQGAFSTEFWLWANYKSGSVNFDASPEIRNTKDTKFSNFLLDSLNGVKWMQKKCRTTIMHDWDVRNFPFDKQLLKIKMEETNKDISKLVYVPDLENTKIDSLLSLEEWNLDSVRVLESNSTYNTTYGDPILSGSSKYAGVNVDVYISRLSSWTMLIKMTTGLYVAFIISLLVFFILPPDSESRIGLAVGGLFAAVGNKYIVESIVPTSTQTTLIDNLHNVTFFFIMIIIAAVIYATNAYVKGNQTRSASLDKYAFWTILVTYCLINILLINSAAS